MALLGLDGYNANDQAPLGDYSPMPDGDYQAFITESQMKTTRAGTGEYLELKWEVVSPDQYQGRNVWCILNLRNPSSKAVEIAKRELGDLCRAVRVMAPKDSTELHDTICTIKLATEQREGYSPKNVIKAYFPMEKAAPTANPVQPSKTEKNSDVPW